MDNIIIIHPGSLYLRIGKASDLNPEMILNCVARRRKNNGEVYHDSILPDFCTSKTKEFIQEMDDARLNVSHTLQNCIQSDRRKRYGTPSAQLASFNKRVHPEIVNPQGGASTNTKWLRPKDKVNYVVGADV
jgi:actin-related protein 8